MGKVKWKGDLKDQAVETVLRLISNGNSLRSILNEKRDKDKLPSRRVFNGWLRDDELIRTQYACACNERADAIFEQILEIADESSKDKITTNDGRIVHDNENTARSRVRIDARKWMLGKLNPSKYGDTSKIDLNVKVEQPLFPDLDNDV